MSSACLYIIDTFEPESTDIPCPCAAHQDARLICIFGHTDTVVHYVKFSLVLLVCGAPERRTETRVGGKMFQ